MRALGTVLYHSLDLGKHVVAVAVPREPVHAHLHPPVCFRNGEQHGADLDFRHAFADNAASFCRTNGDRGICTRADHYPQVGTQCASAKDLGWAKIRGRIRALQLPNST
jgi:hypothetical protein